MSDQETPLAAIAAALEDSGMMVVLDQLDPDLPLERLSLLLTTDRLGRDIVLQLMFINDINESVALSADLAGLAEDDDTDEFETDEFDADEEDEDATLLLFSIVLPFKATAETAVETMRVLLAVNRLLPIGAFGYSESDGALYLAYPLALEDKAALTPLVLEEIINMLGFAAESYGELLESAASGAASASEILADLRDAGLEMPGVGDPPAMRQQRH